MGEGCAVGGVVSGGGFAGFGFAGHTNGVGGTIIRGMGAYYFWFVCSSFIRFQMTSNSFCNVF